ncbi:hypothetical protein BH09ACT4_BH09ACT4_11600 [soil metagenome]
MPRPPIVSLAVAAILLLAACSAPNPDPAEPIPEGSAPPSSAATDDPAPDPVTEVTFEPCDEANAHALGALSSGEMLTKPTGDYYPDYLPLPSCVIEEPDFGDATAFFIPATRADYDMLTAAITAEQGAGVPSDGQGLSTDGVLWAGQRVDGMFLVPPSLGVTLDFIFISVVMP